MRYLVISDIHGNYPALQTVLADAPPWDVLLCLGDIVGYGPNPNECVDRLRQFEHIAIAGNHDCAAIGRVELSIFNQDARQALYWTIQEMTPRSFGYLGRLPDSHRLDDEILLVHGSPREPTWEYLIDPEAARESFEVRDFRLALVGHTHIPLMFEWASEVYRVKAMMLEPGEPIRLQGRRLIINPGSVGQPRDGNPRASYGLLDTESGTFEMRRVVYPVEITQERMRARSLPRRLVDRLEIGR